MLTVLALSAALIQTPPAPPRPPEPPERFMMMGMQGPGGLDKDGDGQVSREEFSAPMNEHFARRDTNGDGRLSSEELSSGHGPEGDSHVIIMRTGPDGEAGEHRWVERSGPDGDQRTMVFTRRGPEAGGVRVEREVIIRGPGGEGDHHRMRRPGPDGAPGGPRVEFLHSGGPGDHGDMDADGDGRISEAEFLAPMREAFASMDADGSGFVEAAERGAGRDVRVFTRRIERDGGDD